MQSFQRISHLPKQVIKDIDKIKNHWMETAEDDFKAMNNLFKAKSYNWALFVGHITTEKLLKAFYVKLHGTHAPAIHNLYRLAELCEIKLTDEYSDWLDTITSFNINARYDDYRKEFYNLCTREFTELWVNRIKELREWIKKML
ncbi:MAG: HEPN domain-containing protein [Proteobacteria bacterium]|nr:HEPN domain-containing protein [Pseudomonadota bacterium]